ncbi:MAG: MOSC domain-containing protein [Roseovarius sp.]
MAKVRALWRHPIKGHGREAMERVDLTEGQTIPWDRRWAVTHEMTQSDGSEWAACANYSRGSKVPELMAINTVCDVPAGMVKLTHPDRPDLSFDPDGDPQAFLNWVRPLMPVNRAQSTGLHRVPDRGMTDTDYPSVSLINLASNGDLGARMQAEVSPLRWRCNIHFDGVPAWDELSWTHKTLTIGTAQLRVEEPIVRCMATTANPATGTRDLDTLGALDQHWNHQHFGIYAVVTRSGEIAVGDTMVLS